MPPNMPRFRGRTSWYNFTIRMDGTKNSGSESFEDMSAERCVVDWRIRKSNTGEARETEREKNEPMRLLDADVIRAWGYVGISNDT